MEYEIKNYRSICALKVFIINGVEAEVEDFGDKFDTDPDSTECGGCGNMQFLPVEATEEVLKKYKITKEEYGIICEKLGILSFGNCGWCV